MKKGRNGICWILLVALYKRENKREFQVVKLHNENNGKSDSYCLAGCVVCAPRTKRRENISNCCTCRRHRQQKK